MEMPVTTSQIFPVWDPKAYHRAGPTDLIELRPPPGGQPLLLEKASIETLVRAIVRGKALHVSGWTGTAKTSLIKAICLVPENFRAVCEDLGFAVKPVCLYEIEMVTFETPGELLFRRALKEGSTYDEESTLVGAIQEAAQARDTHYPVIWLKEIGRVHSASIQGGLLNLMDPAEIVLWDGRRLDGRAIAWVADSNYQAERDATHVLVTFDEALQRRFVNHLTLDYLAPEQEMQVVLRLAQEASIRINEVDLVMRIIKLGQVIRRHRADGTLQSLSPPTIPAYLEMLEMTQALPHWSLLQIAKATLLGNASRDDQKLIPGVFNEVFGMPPAAEDDVLMGGNLF